MIRIIFICTGNVCRSPMAHYYAQKLANNSKNKNNLYIESAGINACEGQAATAFAVKVMQKYNIDLSTHRATHIDNSDIIKADYIIVMTNMQKKILQHLYPGLINKIYTLKEIAYGKDIDYLDIDDPWGYNIDVYEDIAKQIIEAVEAFINKLEDSNEQ